jgi:hypothetical protein
MYRQTDRQTEVTIYCDICAPYHGTDILNLFKNVLEGVQDILK